MVRKLLIVVLVVLALGVASMFLPARQMDVEGIGHLSFETKITLSVGSGVAYAAPDLITNSPSADSGSWTNPTNAYADGGGYASITSGTPSGNHTYSGYGFNLTGNQINQVRVRYDAWCAGNPANQQRVPAADGDVRGRWNTAPRWDDVDETTPNDADYMTGVNTPGGYGYCLFTFNAFSLPTGATITDLTVYFRARDSGGGNPANNMRCSLKIGGTYYHTTAPSVDPDTSFTTYSYAYTVNPATGSAWTVADINGTGANPLEQFGVYSTDLNPDIQVSMVYAQVNYAQCDEQIRVDVSWDSGTSWSSKQITTLTGSEATYWYDVTSATTWTPDKLSDANFRVRVDAYTQGTASEVRLDWIPVEVDYTPPSSCWLSGWAKRVKLTIDHNDIDAPLSNFPVLVYLSSASGRANPKDDVTFIFDELQSDANRFKIAVTTSDCITQCYVEIEKWDQTNEQAWLWVRVPAISDTTDTELHLYYDSTHADNTTYVGDPTSTPGQQVWSNGFAAVWHLRETTGGSDAIKDSTANAHHGTDNGSPTFGAAGRIDSAIDFDGGDDYIQTLSGESQTAENISWELWFKADSTTSAHHLMWEGPASQNGWGEPGDATTHEMHLSIGRYDTADLLDFFYGYEYTSGDFAPAVEIQTAFSDTTNFHYAVAVLTGAGSSPSGTLYLDGSSVGTDTGTETDRSNWDTNLRIGRCGADQRYFEGIGDEVRVSTTDRSAAWIGASYESGRDDLIDFGPEEGSNISNTPSSKDFGYVGESHSYWSNGSDPTFPLDDAECYFTLTNLSSAPANISIRATNFTGGVGWTLASSPGVNMVTLKGGRSGDNLESDMLTMTTSDQSFITSLAAFSSKKWELKLETGTFTDGVAKTSTVTLTASIA